MNVAITGEGVLSAIGKGKAETLLSLRERRSGVCRMRHLRSVHNDLPVGEVAMSNEQMKEELLIAAEKEVSRTALMAMIAIREAFNDAGISVNDLGGKRVALVSGTTVGGMDITERHFMNHDLSDDLSFFRQHDCGGCTNVVADYFANFAQVTTISTACSSSANAIIVGAEMLRNGEADIVVAGGSEALSLFHLNGFNSLMILDNRPCRPFDANRAGINLGEGAAYVIMESEESAKSRHSSVHAYLTGYGNACDAYHQTAMSEDGEGAYLAMCEALNMAGLCASDIQYVNAHGTGTPNNDKSETVALKRIFGDNLPPVSSTKSFTGHTTSASGSIEAVICLLAMRYGFIPANLGWATSMNMGLFPSMGEDNVNLVHVLSNSFGFGGNDSSLVFSATPTADNATPVAVSEEDIWEAARVEVCSEEELTEISKYIKPLEARRMGKLIKASLLTSLKALEKAGIESPDAIVTATAFGCVYNSEQMLNQLVSEGETTVSPTLFMQSTHNTISSAIAIRTHCHGYNITYSHGKDSLSWAMHDARRLLRSGRYKNVLVGYHDESTPLFCKLEENVSGQRVPPIYSISILLSCTR